MFISSGAVIPSVCAVEDYRCVSNGRAEAIVGRGSFTESYPLFGYDTKDYDLLFEEKLDLFAKLVRDQEVSWQGQTRTGLERARIQPPLGPQGMTVWVGVGGSPAAALASCTPENNDVTGSIGPSAAEFVEPSEIDAT